MSAKGQVVIPKSLRDRLNLLPGTRLDVVEGAGGIFLRIAGPQKQATFEECEARIRARIKYRGPVYTDDDFHAAIDAMFREGKDVTA